MKAENKDLPLKAVVFDPFGTLIYFEKPPKPFNEYCELNSAELDNYTRKLTYEALRHNMSYRKFTTKLQKPQLAFVDDYRQELKNSLASAKIYPDTISVLTQLRASGLKIGICANAAHAFKRIPRTLGLAPFIDAYVWSCDTGVIMPQEKPYRSICDKFKLSPKEIVYCSTDFDSNLFGAMKIGMASVLMKRNGISEHYHVRNLEGIIDYISEDNQIFDEETRTRLSSP
jgi:FMN phosphatase YigB (HAD superfamily)